jgi:hypothetical protein
VIQEGDARGRVALEEELAVESLVGEDGNVCRLLTGKLRARAVRCRVQLTLTPWSLQIV